jgi:flagellar biosynthesis protein FlhG
MRRSTLTAIGSGKGGTGKTLVATALAGALSRTGERVLLCDADVGLANAGVHLGLEAGGDLCGVLSGRTPLRSATVPVGGGCAEPGGFDLVSAPAGSGVLSHLDPTSTARLVTTLRAAADYDRVLLDLSAGVETATMHFATAADQTLLVMTGDPASLTDAYAFVKLLLRLGGRVPRVVVNMAESEGEARRTGEALIKTCRTFLMTEPDWLGAVPRDRHVVAAIRRQCAIYALYPDSPAARAFETIARQLHRVQARDPRPDARRFVPA